ncbi:MAG TPA: preprotein translocase subunit SecA [Candidatus Omnitrophota bacterium]|nr:preprotein translocase subunit SecA [Candidatus Omnitrophota bacterium]
MLDFLLQKGAIKGAQKFIDRLEPKVSVHVHPEIPFSSLGQLKKMCIVVSQVNGMEEAISKLSDEQLKAKTQELKGRYAQAVAKDREEFQDLEKSFREAKDFEEKESLNLQIEKKEEEFRQLKQEVLRALIPEAFAVVREVGKRTLNMRHFDVQLIGGMVLNDGNIAEMTTGEGKTLVATLPAYLNALTGEGVHIVTVNDYLAKRDREWMGPIFEFLGLTVGVIVHDLMPKERQQEYGCDITYGTNNEFGFDYLRDNMVSFKEEMVQRPHHYAIVDEVDSILVDEARTPLIISGPAEESTDKYYRANEIVKKLKGRRITDKDESEAKYKQVDLMTGYDYLANEKDRSINLTEEGEIKAAKMFGVDNLHDMQTMEDRHHILQALKAKEFFKIDVDYVAKDGEVIIVDEFTGRLMPGRRWSDGLHQAVEAKEGIKIERENQTLATITFQNYFRLYEKLAGMTGTANTEASEFKEIYELDVVVIPTNKPMKRNNYADSVYRSLREKYNAIVAEIEECHKRGQPSLVGTISIEKSEHLSRMLAQQGIAHQVLNAKYHEQEANIIAQAGRFKAVTIATNMAGRGTDIVLGGNAEFLAKNLAAQKASEAKDELEKENLVKKFLEQFRQQCKEEQRKVIEQGGLHVIGSERHESRRIDNQLRGRQGRQGDPGSSRFYVSLEDDLMRLFASDRIIGLMDKLGMEEGQVLEHPWLTGAIENAQRRVEAHNFEIRKHLLEYDNVMNRQREVIYDLRRTILESSDIRDQILGYIEETLQNAIPQYLNTQQGEEVVADAEGLDVYLKSNFGYDLGDLKGRLQETEQAQVIETVLKGVLDLYAKKEQAIGAQPLRYMERMFLLNTIDTKWKDHLYAMDQLKSGIGLRSFAQRDPLIEYKKEGFAMFEMMYATIAQEVAEIIFKIHPVGEAPARPRGVFSSLPQRLVHDEITSLSASARAPVASQPQPAAQASPPKLTPIQSNEPKVGRNDPCPCGSGKKYKKCCGK